MHIKYLCLIPILMFSGCVSNSNFVIEERTWHPVTYPVSNSTETFHFYRDGNREVRHGIYLYKKVNDDGKIISLTTGAYVNGMRQGLWTHEHGFQKSYSFFSEGKCISTDTYNLFYEKIASTRTIPISGNSQYSRWEGTSWGMDATGKKGKISTCVEGKIIKTDDCDENGYIIAEDSGIIVKDNLAYRKGEDMPFTGVIVTYHDNSSFSSKKHFKKGVFTGKLEYFNPDGSLKSVTPEKSAEVKGNTPSQSDGKTQPVTNDR